MEKQPFSWRSLGSKILSSDKREEKKKRKQQEKEEKRNKEKGKGKEPLRFPNSSSSHTNGHDNGHANSHNNGLSNGNGNGTLSWVGTGDPGRDARRGNIGLMNVPTSFATEPSHVTEGSLPVCEDGGQALRYRQTLLGSSREHLLGSGSQFKPDPALLQPPQKIPELEKTAITAAKERLADMHVALLDSARKAFQDRGKDWYVPLNELDRIMSLEAIESLMPYICREVVTSSDPATPGDSTATDDPSATGESITTGHPTTASYPTAASDQITAMAIFGVRSQDHDAAEDVPVSYRNVLATLILIQKADKISDFYKHKIHDEKLPLQRLQIGTGMRYKLCLEDSTEALACFDGWDYTAISLFEERQYVTLAPFFAQVAKKQDTTEKPEALLHPTLYELSSRRPIPFEEIETQTQLKIQDPISSESTDPLVGAYAVVKKVKIHESHHKLHNYTGQSGAPLFAVKQLLTATRAEFNNEVRILTSFSTSTNPHLVKLILSMEIVNFSSNQQSYYLMFPLAQGNVQQMWGMVDPHEGTSYPRWLAEQCHGLAGALNQLHTLPRTRPQGGNPKDKEPIYCNHGDIKPQNLLWYPHWPGAKKGGVIQLADFGISTIHRTETKSNFNISSASVTYSPPEAELRQNISLSFDIWCLGCVFLEMLGWLVNGKEYDFKKFREERELQGRNRGVYSVEQDTFYTVRIINGIAKAEVNEAVSVYIQGLHSHKRCTGFVHDFLDLIVKEMLVVESKQGVHSEDGDGYEVVTLMGPDGSNKRVRSDGLVERLQKIAFHKEDSYYNDKPSRPRIGDSWLSATSVSRGNSFNASNTSLPPHSPARTSTWTRTKRSSITSKSSMVANRP